MSEPVIVDIESFEVYGLGTRTKNLDEFNPETAKIGPLWQDFQQTLIPKVLAENKMPEVYGVYHNYESDHHGVYSLLAGVKGSSDDANLSKVSIAPGKYLCFEKQGEMPQACIELWQEVWALFESGDCPHQWDYSCAFEEYVSEDRVKIYIKIH